MFIGKFNITNQWAKFSDLIGETTEKNITYFIQNNGVLNIICRESKSVPDKKDEDGIILFPNNSAEYKKGEGELYLKILKYSKFNGIISISSNK